MTSSNNISNLSETMREFLYRVEVAIPLEHAAWVRDIGGAILEQVKAGEVVKSEEIKSARSMSMLRDFDEVQRAAVEVRELAQTCKRGIGSVMTLEEQIVALEAEIDRRDDILRRLSTRLKSGLGDSSLAIQLSDLLSAADDALKASERRAASLFADAQSAPESAPRSQPKI